MQGIVCKRYLVTVKVHCYVDLLLWRTLVNFLSAETQRILFQNVSIWRSSAGDNWNNILVSATRKFANILQNVPCVCLCTFTVCKLVVILPYSAWGSNFLQIVILTILLKEFAAHVHYTCIILWVWHTNLVCLTRTTTLPSAWARSCKQSLERVPCRFGSLALGCCPSALLQSEREKCVLCVEIFLETFCEISKIKDP